MSRVNYNLGNCVGSRHRVGVVNEDGAASNCNRGRMENADVFLGLHDFLERMRQPSAADFVKAIKRFFFFFLFLVSLWSLKILNFWLGQNRTLIISSTITHKWLHFFFFFAVSLFRFQIMLRMLRGTVARYKSSSPIWKPLSRLIHFGPVAPRRSSKVPVKSVSTLSHYYYF